MDINDFVNSDEFKSVFTNASDLLSSNAYVNASAHLIAIVTGMRNLQNFVATTIPVVSATVPVTPVTAPAPAPASDPTEPTTSNS